MICLCMIVKDESERIRKALRSVKPLIDCWVIVDTGSTDNTKEIILDEMIGTPGTLLDRPWEGWTKNRNEVLSLARNTYKPDYLLILDGDQEVVATESVSLGLSQDFIYCAIHCTDSLEFKKPFILPTQFNWRYEGVTHEYLTCAPATPRAITLPVIVRESGRLKTSEYFLKDAKILEGALAEDPNNARNVFYLAQSYRDAGSFTKAIELYKQRVKMDGWHEEVWYSLYQIAMLKVKQGASLAQVIPDFLLAYEYDPTRAESLGTLAHYCVVAQRYNLAKLFAHEAMQLPMPEANLFVDRSWYVWKSKDEYAVASAALGDYTEAMNAWASLLNKNVLPEFERDRVKKNWEQARRAQEKKDGGL